MVTFHSNQKLCNKYDLSLKRKKVGYMILGPNSFHLRKNLFYLCILNLGEGMCVEVKEDVQESGFYFHY